MANYITLQNYAELNGVPFRTVQTRARQGQIPTIKIGNSVMIEKSTPWVARKIGKPSNAERAAKSKSKPKYKVEIQRAYYVAVVDRTGKEVASDFTFCNKEDAKKLGEKLKAEVERKSREVQQDTDPRISPFYNK